MKLSKGLLLLCVAFFMGGCAANMPLSKGQESVSLSSESIALVSVKISNQNKPEYQPSLLYAFFFPESEGAKKTHISINTDPIRSEKNQFNEYLLSFSLKPGTYNFSQIWGVYRVPLLMNAMCQIPLNAKVDIKPNEVIYLGNIDAVIRERKNDGEVRAGGVIPLIDQAVAGFSSGTFEVSINDRFDEDIKAFMAEYPALQNHKVEKAVLPQWTRPETTVAKSVN